MRWVAGLTLLALGAGACGSKGTTAGQLHDCAPDGAAWVTPPSPEAGAGTAAAELSCPGSISDYCFNYATGCPPSTWAAAVASQNATGFPPNLYICDSYDWADDGWVCGGLNSVVFAYDKATGKLLAAVELSPPGRASQQQICLAGPSTIAPYGPCTAYFDCNPNDAGLDRGDCYGDGGVDGSGNGG